MGNTQMSTPKFPRTTSSFQSLDKHQNYAEWGGANVQAVCPQVLAVDAAGTDGGRDLTFASARFTGVCAAQKYQ